MELDADPSRLAGGKGVFQGVLHQLVDHQGHRGGAVRGHNGVLAAHVDGDTAGGGQKGLEHVPADLLQNLKEGDLLPGDLYDAVQRGGQGSSRLAVSRRAVCTGGDSAGSQPRLRVRLASI